MAEAARYRSAALTHTGRVREHNEDAILARPEVGLWAVADGMGGHAAGEVASTMIVKALGALERPPRLADFVDRIEDTLIDANRALRALARERGVGVIGATVVVLVGAGEHMLCLWAGDSRAYRAGAAGLERLTRDHSVVEELLAQGTLTAQQAENHPQANAITRAVGAADSLHLDVTACRWGPNDLFLLCSDGLTKVVPDPLLDALLADIRVPEPAAALLLARTLEGGAPDNVSVVTVAAA